MRPPFRRLSVEEVARLLSEFAFTRQVNVVHLHHTWRPNHAQYRGEDSILAMWRFHTDTNGWSDIAQHVSIGPEGAIWTGRNWDEPPASAAGHNGNRDFGPFMIEMIGDFDAGNDRLDGAQREATVEVIARVQKRFNLPPEALRFHNQMGRKTCPGTSVVYAEIVEAVRRHVEAPMVGAGPAVPDVAPAGPRGGADKPSLREDEPSDTEPAHGGEVVGVPSISRPLRTATGVEDLRPHVVNLTEGRFSTDGFTTSRADVDAIFEQHLPRWAETVPRLRVVFFAHGGLVSESDGLAIARKHVRWWKENGVYPVYFVWETGLLDALGSMSRPQPRALMPAAPRDLLEHVSDPVVERLVRPLGRRVWAAMKWSAEQAVANETAMGEGGGARYVAARLADFCRSRNGNVKLHAVGHSAGSIFHAHFLPVALDLQTPAFTTVQLLAPAVRTDTFLRRLGPRLGRGIDRLTVFTMREEAERADTCLGVYRKSLLYLIRYALEPERNAAILGLEESLREDAALSRLLGIDAGSRPPAGEVVWAPTEPTSGGSASRATSHGGFDDDPATMGSVVRRVLGVGDDVGIREYGP